MQIYIDHSRYCMRRKFTFDVEYCWKLFVWKSLGYPRSFTLSYRNGLDSLTGTTKNWFWFLIWLNRCGNCFDCPSCCNTLVIRATAVIVPPSNPLAPKADETGKSPSVKKMHYLFCSFCRWTSRDAGLDDQPSGKLFIQNLVWKNLKFRLRLHDASKF